MNSLVLRRCRVIGDDTLIDVAIGDGRISAVGPRLEMPAAVEEIDLDGRWLMPGLWDAHVHFTQWARFRGRVDVSGSASAAEVVARLAARVGAAGVGEAARASEVVIGRGFQDALWPDAMTAEALDGAFGNRPVVVISHDLHCVWLNTAAASRFGAPHAGVLREDAAFAVQIALDAETTAAQDDAMLRNAVAAASARGVVGIRDLEMADNVETWMERVGAGFNALRVEACIYQPHLAASDARGMRTGDIAPGTAGLVTVGALKVFADGSLNTRTALTHEPYGHGLGDPSVGHAAHSEEGLRELLTAARERGLDVALHAIGDAAVTRALDAFEGTGAHGTIEHAQLVRESDLPRFAKLGIAASVQPQHAIDDRDVADALWADRAERAFPYRSLHDAGARLLLGSDAPVAPLDPWVAIAAAVHRSDDERPAWHPEQRLTVAAAMEASTRVGGARGQVARGQVTRGQVARGQVADVIAVEADPLTAKPAELREMAVALTIVDGRVTYASS